MTEVRGLWCYLKDKEKRERQVATVKTLLKMGVSLAPVIGGALGVGVDAVAIFAGSTAGAAAVYDHLADPTNLDVARKVLRGLREVESKLTSEERSVLVAPLRPHLSVEGVLQEVKEAAQILGIDAEAADAGVVDDAAQGEVLRDEATNGGAGATAAPGKDERGGLEAGAAAPDSGGAAADSSSDPWEKPKDAAIGEVVERVAERTGGRLRGDAAPVAAGPVASPAITTGAAGGAALAAADGGGPPSPAVPTPAVAVVDEPASQVASTAGARDPLVHRLAGGPGVETPPTPGHPHSPLFPELGTLASALPAGSPSPLRRARTQPPPLPTPRHSSRRADRLQGGAPPAAAPAGSTAGHFGRPFLPACGTGAWTRWRRSWSIFVASGYPQADRDAFAAAVCARARQHRVVGAAAVCCANAADVKALSECLLDGEWRGSVETMLSVRRFLDLARAYAKWTRGEAP